MLLHEQSDDDLGEAASGASPSELYLIVLLRDRPAVGFLTESPATGFRVGGSRFDRTLVGDFIGFYDGLRGAEGLFTGLYCHGSGSDIPLLASRTPRFDDLFREFRECLEAINYAEIDGFMIKIVLKNDLQPAMVEPDGEQVFGETIVYRSESGEFAISFDMYSLLSNHLINEGVLSGTDRVEAIPVV